MSRKEKKVLLEGPNVFKITFQVLNDEQSKQRRIAPGENIKVVRAKISTLG